MPIQTATSPLPGIADIVRILLAGGIPQGPGDPPGSMHGGGLQGPGTAQPTPSGPIWAGFPPVGGPQGQQPSAPPVGRHSFADPARLYRARPEPAAGPSRPPSAAQQAASQRRASGGSLARMKARRGSQPGQPGPTPGPTASPPVPAPTVPTKPWVRPKGSAPPPMDPGQLDPRAQYRR